MTDEDYCFLHGFPTTQSGCYGDGSGNNSHQSSRCLSPLCAKFPERVQEAARQTDRPWRELWADILSQACAACAQERQCRRRVLGCDQHGGISPTEAQQIPGSVKYVKSVFITECNKPVCLYSMLRAQHFARLGKVRPLWMQAEDVPPSEHFAHYTRQELEKLKKKWLAPTYHARKTEGILSLLPCAFDMPW